MQSKPLGEILTEAKLVAPDQLKVALALQKKQGGRLGDVLVASGVVNYHQLYQAVAKHYDLPYIDLLQHPPDRSLLNPQLADQYIQHRVIPYKREDGKILMAAAEFDEGMLAFAKRLHKEPVEFVCTSPFDIRRAVEHAYATEMELHSRLWLWHSHPAASARDTLAPRQKAAVHSFLILATLVLILFPMQFAFLLFAVCHVIYAITMTFKQLAFSSGASCATRWDWKKHFAELNEDTLPRYTILLPMYRETESLPGLLQSMEALDYPADKLDIKLILEADDTQMLDAAMALRPRHQFEIIRVPPGTPRTKPRACNYALRFARGKYITIFDADDRPEATQLKKAVITFNTLPPDVICLQARLNYYNANQNLLTRFFSLEYSILFHFLLYGLQRLNMPIPLGGTSNHISVERLKALGEWDPYNVTEDADLGARLDASGYKTAMLDSYTMEEAPTRSWPWIKQRSRWVKGYMQTWLVHMRSPIRFYRNIGLKSFIGFQCFIGLPGFTFLTSPLVWLVSALWIGQVADWHSIVLPVWLMWLTALNLVINFFTLWYQAFYCAWLYKKHKFSMSVTALLYPLYMILHTIASYRALWQLIVKPHFWDKTMHGIAPLHTLGQKEPTRRTVNG